jgi:hypothetical protein
MAYIDRLMASQQLITMSDQSNSASVLPVPESTLLSNPQGTKGQPWRAVWPSPRESQPQAQIFGFKKGETMVFDGNAGNFFARSGWTVEQKSD